MLERKNSSILSLGISKLEIFGQFLIEMVFISIPAFVGSYFLAQYTADSLGIIY